MRKLTLKEKQFVKITAQTLNPSQAVRETYNIGSKGGGKTKQQREQIIRTIASQNLTKLNIKKGLEEVMEEKGIDNTLITKITKRNLKQDKNIPASNQVIDMYHKLKGNYAPEKRLSISITPETINNRLKELEYELKQLQEEA